MILGEPVGHNVDMPARLRPNVLRMEPYLTGKPIDEVQREYGLDRIVKLASNENPFGPSPLAVKAIKEASEKMHLYPDGSAYALKQALAYRFEIPASQVILGNGSDEIIHLLGLMYLGTEDDEMIMGDPSFSRYDASAHLAPSTLVKVALDADYRHDLKAMAKAVTPKTKLLFIANPNNPTGTIVSQSEVEYLLDEIPDHVTVVLDEAYQEFAAHAPGYADGLGFVKAGRNVIVLRTFSKAYGLAGIRVGFGFCAPEVVDAMNRAREPFNVNSLAQAAAIAALDDEDHLKKTVENNTRGLERLAQIFRKVGARPIESYANFAYADFGRPAQPIFQALLQQGVITRSGEKLGNPTCLRVSVGTDEELDAFETALHTALELAKV